MARSITAYDFYDALGVSGMPELLNTMRNTAGNLYQRNVPEATLENIQLVGAGVLQFPATQNDFIQLLIEHVALTVLKDSQLQNDFAPFKSGTIITGRHVEEIFVDRLESTPFDLYDGEDEAFTIVKPDIKVIFHTRNRQDKFEVSISEADLTTAFQSIGQLESFILRIINQLVSSNEADEYEYTMALFDNYQDKKLFKEVLVPNYKSTTDRVQRRQMLEELAETVRAHVTRLTLGVGSRDYNALSVQRRSSREDLYLFVSPELEAAMDVNVMASAFNMDKASFLSHVFVVSDFSDPGMLAALVDRNWFQIYDNKKTMANMYNGANLTMKYFYHVWNTFSVSQVENAVAFVTDTGQTGVYRIGFQAMEADVRGGSTYQAIPIVRAYEDDWDPEKVTYALTGADKAGTTVSATGVVTVAADETARVLTLTVSYDNGTDEEPAIVSGTMKIYPVKTIG